MKTEIIHNGSYHPLEPTIKYSLAILESNHKTEVIGIKAESCVIHDGKENHQSFIIHLENTPIEELDKKGPYLLDYLIDEFAYELKKQLKEQYQDLLEKLEERGKENENK